jgi:secernin
MGCDMVVALGTATGTGQAFFAANSHRPVDEAQAIRLVPGRTFAAGETLSTRFVQVPQVRQTCTVLAAQPHNHWGYLQGVNEHRVAVGVSDWQSRLERDRPGLLGTELVRLTLERAHNARHGVETLTDLIVRHGQGAFAGSPEGEACDHVFLIVDPNQAFAVEAASLAWAVQEIGQVRAASDVAVIRQDWNRLAPGLADRAINEGWWTQDGSKLDFLGALSEQPTGKASALRRWGRAMLLVEQQSGRVDASFLRRLLADHYEGSRYEVDPLEGPAVKTPVCQHALFEATTATAVSGVIQLPSGEGDTAEPVYWVALGPPCLGIYFPLLLAGDLPAALGGDPPELWVRSQQLLSYANHDRRRWLRLREALGPLQTCFEQQLDEFLVEAAALKAAAETVQLRRLASSLMQNQVERFEETAQQLLTPLSATMEFESLALGGALEF